MLEHVTQAAAPDVLHGDEALIAVEPDVVDGDDARVVQPGCKTRLTNEPLPGLLIAGRVGAQDLDRDVALEACVMRQVHFSHAPCAERRNDFIGAQPRSWADLHGSRNYTAGPYTKRL